jgi:hypothetical protein
MNVTFSVLAIVLAQYAHHLINTFVENRYEVIQNVEMKGRCYDFALSKPFSAVSGEQSIAFCKIRKKDLFCIILYQRKRNFGETL